MGKRARTTDAAAAPPPVPAADGVAAAPDADSPAAAAADGAADAAPAPRRRGAKPLSAEALAAFNAAERAKGLLYLARVPPHMQPSNLRALLSRFGELGRLYLAPEDAAVTARRAAAGGSKRALFVEGWVEFLDKRAARLVAEVIHNTPIGDSALGRARRGRFATDLWNVRYLPHFKWHHLKEKVAYEKRARIMALRSKLVEARRGAEAYLARVDQAKAIEGQREKRRKRATEGGAGEGSGGGGGDAPRRFFPQLQPVEGGAR